MPSPETCANCSRQLGALEDVYLWNDRPICFECHQRLRAQRAERAPSASDADHSPADKTDMAPLLQALGVVLACIGAGMMVFGEGTGALGLLLGLLGLLVFAGGRIAAGLSAK